MQITTPTELAGLVQSGRGVRAALMSMESATRAGESTDVIDSICQGVLTEWRMKGSARPRYNFPGCACISVNNEALHGIPGKRILKPGDLVKLDLVAEWKGFHTDAAITVIVEGDDEQRADLNRRLKECAKRAFDEALKVVRPGGYTWEIGLKVEAVAKAAGFNCLDGFGGHGVGKTIHEPPYISNIFQEEEWIRFEEGMVFTIEPIITERSGVPVKLSDGWTIATADGGRTSHFEHTVVVTATGAQVVT